MSTIFAGVEPIPTPNGAFNWPTRTVSFPSHPLVYMLCVSIIPFRLIDLFAVVPLQHYAGPASSVSLRYSVSIRPVYNPVSFSGMLSAIVVPVCVDLTMKHSFVQSVAAFSK